MKNELQMMPGVEWVVAKEETPTPAKDLVGVPTMELVLAPIKKPVDTPVADDIERIATGVPSIRPWAKPLLAVGLGLSVMWLEVLIVLLLSAELWAQASVAVGVAGFPIVGLLTIGFIADPSRESPDEEYVSWLFDNEGSYAASICSPNRHTLTGRNQ